MCVVAYVVVTAYRYTRDQNKRKAKPDVWKASDVLTDDPIAAECIARAANSGKMVFAHVDEDGHVTFSEG